MKSGLGFSLFRRVMALLVLAVMAVPLAAQDAAVDPAKQAAAKDLLAAMNVQEQFRKTLDSMQNVLAAQMKAQPGGDKAMSLIAKVFEADSDHVKAYLADAETAMLGFYASRFTTEEMKDITTFQLSPAGKKLQAAMPEMVQALGPPIGKFQESVKTIMMQELTAKPKP